LQDSDFSHLVALTQQTTIYDYNILYKQYIYIHTCTIQFHYLNDKVERKMATA